MTQPAGTLRLIDRPESNSKYEATRRLLADTYPMDGFKDDRNKHGPTPYGFHIWGPCPNCGHTTSGLVPCRYLADSIEGALVGENTKELAQGPDDATTDVSNSGQQEKPPGETAVSAEAAVPREETALSDPSRPTSRGEKKRLRPGAVRNITVFKCACVADHSKDGKFGCGSEWMLSVEYIPGKPNAKVIKNPVNYEEAALYWAADDEIAANFGKSASTAQALAKVWVGVLTSLVGILTLAAVIGGRDTIKSLPWYYQLTLGIAAALALAADGAVIYFSNMAGIGFPKIGAALPPPQLRNADLNPLITANEISTQLTRASRAAVASGVMAAVATGIFLFAPATTHAAKGDVQLAYHVGTQKASTSCGALVVDDPAGTETLTPDGGSATVFKITDVVSITKC